MHVKNLLTSKTHILVHQSNINYTSPIICCAPLVSVPDPKPRSGDETSAPQKCVSL